MYCHSTSCPDAFFHYCNAQAMRQDRFAALPVRNKAFYEKLADKTSAGWFYESAHIFRLSAAAGFCFSGFYVTQAQIKLIIMSFHLAAIFCSLSVNIRTTSIPFSAKNDRTRSLSRSAAVMGALSCRVLRQPILTKCPHKFAGKYGKLP